MEIFKLRIIKNKVMKNLKIIFIGFFLALVSFGCSDDFLERLPPDALPAEGFLNADRAELAVNAVYATLQTYELYSNTLSKLYDPPTGDAILVNTSGYGFNNFQYTTADPHLMEVYSALYEGVFRANIVINDVPEIEMDADLRGRYVGEAKFLRALYYWHLTTLWGDVPLFTEPVEVPSDALIAKTSREEIYSVMIQDLEDAEAALPLKSSYSASDVGRATKGAAQALLGKVYLYKKNSDLQAEEWFSKVIESGEYDLVDDYGDIININAENNKESIFEVQFAETGQADLGTFRVAYNNPQVNGGTGNTLPTQQMVDAYESNDPRLNHTIFMEGEEFAPDLGDDLATYKSVWSSTGYNLKKGLFPVMYVNNRGTNFPVIRYADVLLMYAEVANQLSMIDEARNAVNKVRKRVDMPLLTPAETGTQGAMFEAIVHERRVELAYEFHRFNDLKRWGLAEEFLGPLGYKPRHRYYPLPQEEIDINDLLEQRTGW
jgi:hypothetical protein